jgi:hypothetical protein
MFPKDIPILGIKCKLNVNARFFYSLTEYRGNDADTFFQFLRRKGSIA